jgi:DNA-binding GntR family transcriptional regulator
VRINMPNVRNNNTFQTVRTRSLPDQIYLQLRQAILTGELVPGQRLVEMEIASRMGTSQGSVREALKQLENESLVMRQSRTGTFVSPKKQDEIFDLFQIRTVVEKAAIRLTAICIEPAQYEHLKQLVDAMVEAARDDNMLVLASNDLEFHKCICEWSGSNTLLRVWTPLHSQILRFLIQDTRYDYNSLEEVASGHEPILDALRSHDSNRASAVIEEHILHSFHKMMVNGNSAS